MRTADSGARARVCTSADGQAEVKQKMQDGRANRCKVVEQKNVGGRAEAKTKERCPSKKMQGG
jgi:hypothetical protein